VLERRFVSVDLLLQPGRFVAATLQTACLAEIVHDAFAPTFARIAPIAMAPALRSAMGLGVGSTSGAATVSGAVAKRRAGDRHEKKRQEHGGDSHAVLSSATTSAVKHMGSDWKAGARRRFSG